MFHRWCKWGLCVCVFVPVRVSVCVCVCVIKGECDSIEGGHCHAFDVGPQRTHLAQLTAAVTNWPLQARLIAICPIIALRFH